MRRSLSDLAVALGLFMGFVGSPVQAMDEAPTQGDQMVGFFQAIESSWRGRGTVRQLQADGRWVSYAYDVEIDVDRNTTRDFLWDVHNEVTYPGGQIEITDTSYDVVGDLLYISNPTHAEPLHVTAASPVNLSYEFDRYDYWSRRTYHFVVSLQLREVAGKLHLVGSTRIFLNRMLISEDQFGVKK